MTTPPEDMTREVIAEQLRLRASRMCADGYFAWDAKLDEAAADAIEPSPRVTRTHTFEGPFYGPPTVVAELMEACVAEGSQKAWAKKHGLSPAYVNDVINGRREPANTIAEALGYECFVIYRRRKEEAP